MNPTPDRKDAAAATAPGELAQLHGQVESMRSLLIRLLQEVVRSESRLDSSHAAQLLEANEQLVVAALRAQTDAVTTAFALDDASQSSQLDVLTQLPNRALLRDRLGHAIASAGRRGVRLALLFVDLDNFKQINDTLGHAIGDEVLKGVARCLVSCVRAADTVGRYGGDEFLILLAEVSQPSAAGLIAEKVIAAIGGLGHVSSQGAPLTASVGISIYPDDGNDAATLIARADAAMYRAKRHRAGTFAFHGQVPAGEPSPASPPRASPAQGATRTELALAEQERRNAQLREANEQLVLAALGARELQAAAEQAQRRQAEFMAAVVNELRNPQAPIRIATAMLGRGRTDEPLLPRVQAIVEQQAAQVSRLVGDLLEAAGATTGTLTLERSRVDMAGLVGDVVACLPTRDGQALAEAQAGTSLVRNRSRRRPAAPRSGRRQPARQRIQVHARGRRDRTRGQGGGRCRRDDGVRQRHRHHR